MDLIIFRIQHYIASQAKTPWRRLWKVIQCKSDNLEHTLGPDFGQFQRDLYRLMDVAPFEALVFVNDFIDMINLSSFSRSIKNRDARHAVCNLQANILQMTNMHHEAATLIFQLGVDDMALYLYKEAYQTLTLAGEQYEACKQLSSAAFSYEMARTAAIEINNHVFRFKMEVRLGIIHAFQILDYEKASEYFEHAHWLQMNQITRLGIYVIDYIVLAIFCCLAAEKLDRNHLRQLMTELDKKCQYVKTVIQIVLDSNDSQAFLDFVEQADKSDLIASSVNEISVDNYFTLFAAIHKNRFR